MTLKIVWMGLNQEFSVDDLDFIGTASGNLGFDCLAGTVWKQALRAVLESVASNTPLTEDADSSRLAKKPFVKMLH